MVKVISCVFLKVELQDIINFITEVELGELPVSQVEFYLRFELHFMEASEEDIKASGNANGQAQTGGFLAPQFRHPFERDEFISKFFKCVSQREFKLNGLKQ